MAYLKRFILKIDSSPTNTELWEHGWLKFILEDLPNQGGVDTRMKGDSIAYNREIILTWVSRGQGGG
jgi:hypothetical protein